MYPIKDIAALMIKQDAGDPYEFPHLISKNVKQTGLEELASYFVVHEGELYLSDFGEREVYAFNYVSQFIFSPLKFSRYAPYLQDIVPISTVKIVEKISSWQEAEMRNCLASYFKDRDYLGVVSGDANSEVEIVYADDYEDYVKTKLSLKEIARKYIKYLERVQRIDTNELIYDVFSTQMAHRSLSQRSQYAAVIDDYDNIAIPSDGLGVFSAMCILADKKYYSWEPNAIGERAIRLGIISGKEFKHGDYIYCYMYCVQYYSLPFFPGQRFLVVDVPHVKKPGFCRDLFCSVSHEDLKYNYLFPSTPMVFSSIFSLDDTMSSVAASLKIKSSDIIKCQFIAASNISSLSNAIVGGFFSPSRVGFLYENLDFVDKKRFVSAKSLEVYLKEKTLLFFDRVFPFRPGSLKWRMHGVHFKKDIGPGWYDDFNSSWIGVQNQKYVITKYEYHNYMFGIRFKGKPPLICFVKLEPILVEIFSNEVLKLLLISTTSVNGSLVGYYTPEIRVIRGNYLVEDDNN